VTTSVDETQWLVAVGAVLRATRLDQGVTLEDVSRETRISKSQLLAIEEGDSARLPAMAYVRGFVRIYGAYLGLTPEQLTPGLAAPQSQTTVAAEEDSAPVSGGNSIRWRRWFAPLSIGSCVLALAYCYQQPDQLPPSRPPVSQQVAPPVAALPVQAARSSARPPISPTTPDPVASVPIAPASTPTGAILKLKVNQDCWLNITIDGAVSQQYDLKAGDLIEWKADESIALDLGNAGGVEAEFNGKPLASFGEPGKVAHIVLKSETGENTLPVPR
jgi:cytoskeletal protein RodZ